MPYSHSASVIIDHTKVLGGSDLANFPILFQGTYNGTAGLPDLRTTANGGQVTNSSGYDIIFTSDSGGSIPLNWEIDSYNAATGAVAFWVQIPTLSASVNTTIYLWWGNSSISTFQGNVNATWDSSYKAVIHFPPSGSTITTSNVTDSTSNGNDLNNVGSTGTAPTLTAGKFGQAGVFGTAGGAGVQNWIYRNAPTGIPSGANVATYEAWFKSALSQNAELWAGGANSGAGSRLGVFINTLGPAIGADCEIATCAASYTPDTTNWHYLVAVMPSGATQVGQILVYLDGTQISASGPTTALNVNSSMHLTAASIPLAENNGNFNGLLDELRVSAAARTAGWIGTCWNSYNSPGTFYSFSSSGGGGLLVNPGTQGGMRPLLLGGCNG